MSKRLCFQQNATLKCSCGRIVVNTMSDFMLYCIQRKKTWVKIISKNIQYLWLGFFFRPDNGKLDLGGVKYVKQPLMVKACSRGRIAAAIYELKIMGGVGPRIIVAIAPFEHFR